MKNLKISLVCDGAKQRKIYDDYGWEIPSSKAGEAFEAVKKELGESELLEELANVLSYQELADNLAFICRMNDLEIPQLENKSVEDVLIPPPAGDYSADNSEEDNVDDNKPWENSIRGQGRIANVAEKYKGFVIVLTKKNTYDIYDSEFAIRAAAYPSVEACKEDIDKFIESGVTGEGHYGDDKEEVKAEEVAVEEVKTEGPKRVIGPGVVFIQQPDGSYITKFGGEANVKGSTKGYSYKTLVEAIEDMIAEGVIDASKISADSKIPGYKNLAKYYQVKDAIPPKQKSVKYKGYFIVEDPAGDGLNIINKHGELIDEGYDTIEDCKDVIDSEFSMIKG